MRQAERRQEVALIQTNQLCSMPRQCSSQEVQTFASKGRERGKVVCSRSVGVKTSVAHLPNASTGYTSVFAEQDLLTLFKCPKFFRWPALRFGTISDRSGSVGFAKRNKTKHFFIMVEDDATGARRSQFKSGMC